MPYIARFDHEQATDHDLVGGKGANLGRLTAAGFPVPGGFTVTTEAYDLFLGDKALRDVITGTLADADYEDAEAMTIATGQIREAILAATAPQVLDSAIREAYAALGGDQQLRVAVRSSGTAEDLAEASFAGMHDTYLDITGSDAVLDAVKRCWASLWTTRATTYRHNQGFDHDEASLAVVIQTMVESAVSGVMFTANPLTTNTDEIVINASWGLGEAIVSGLVTPDEYILSRNSLNIRRRAIAEKSQEILRSEDSGTITREVAAERRSVPCLDESAAADLAALGLRVMEYYEGFPQDIEWALADGELYLLQSRDVTGVEFTWDEQLDATFQKHPDDNDDILWTQQWSREFWNGAISPLHYSIRGRIFEQGNEEFRSVLGHRDIKGIRLFKYRRGTAYFNTKGDALHYRYIMPRALRAAGLGNVHPDDRQEVLDAPLDVTKFVRTFLRMEFAHSGHGIKSWLDVIYGMVEDTRGPGDPLGYGHRPEWWRKAGGLHGFPPEKLRELSDAELMEHTEDRLDTLADYNTTLWDGFFVYAPLTLAALGWMLENWCDSTDPTLLQTLISGLPVRTKAAEEVGDMWDLVDRIRQSDHLRSLFEANEGGAFFEALEGDEEGEEFLGHYREFVKVHGHRGHADRDMWYPRRAENPALDYASFRANLLSDASRSPEAIERGLIEAREAATAEVMAKLRRQMLGFAKEQAFHSVLSYAHRFLQLRDDERWAADIITYTKRVCFQEVARRLNERDQLVEDDDFWFISKEEVFALLRHGGGLSRLQKAQIAARRRAFFKVLAREDDSPLYLRGDQVIPEEIEGGGGVMQGTGTSSGEVTGVARVVRNLENIGRVQKDDILICNSTDPGWASVFLIIRGLVIETGGMLAHGACLSREYGLPAVTLSRAISLIPDGALITVNGDTGQVTIVDEPGETQTAAVEDQTSITGA